jgi:hypothetical protein
VDVIPLAQARELNAAWHSRLPKFGSGFVREQPFLCFGAAYVGRIYSVAIWSNPVARLLPQSEWLELRRLANAPDAPRNTASRMLAVMVKLIRRIRPEITRLISYQDKDAHTGTIYRAAGWTATAEHSGGSWNRPNSKNTGGTPRTRPDRNGAIGPKQRWEFVL